MTKVLFVCIENSCRSQMAEGFPGFYGKGMIEAYSAGSGPSGKVNETAVQVMREAGIDISSQPSNPASKRIDWQIRDPKGKPKEFFREVRDEIKGKVLELIAG